MSHREWEKGRGVWKEVGIGLGLVEWYRGKRVRDNKQRTVGGRNIGVSGVSGEHQNGEEKGKKSNIIAFIPSPAPHDL